jgi:hypothetical protein
MRISGVFVNPDSRPAGENYPAGERDAGVIILTLKTLVMAALTGNIAA